MFSPFGALALAISLNEGLNGRNVYQGTSPLIGKVGEMLFDDKITSSKDKDRKARTPGRMEMPGVFLLMF
jgi:predicted Zn-dependent protease